MRCYQKIMARRELRGLYDMAEFNQHLRHGMSELNDGGLTMTGRPFQSINCRPIRCYPLQALPDCALLRCCREAF